MMVIDKLPKFALTALNWLKNKLREKEKNLKDHFKPYYQNVEDVMVRHVQIINWLAQEQNSWFSTCDDDGAEQYEELEAHNKMIHENALKVSGGTSLEGMANEIENLIAANSGIIAPKLINSLLAYKGLCLDAHQLCEYHFLLAPCHETLRLTRECKAQIPSLHGNCPVE
jgi:hypothetical protein